MRRIDHGGHAVDQPVALLGGGSERQEKGNRGHEARKKTREVITTAARV